MGFLSKLFGGDSEPPSRSSEQEPPSQAVATQVSPPTLGEPKGEPPVQVAVAAAPAERVEKVVPVVERRSADDEPTADLSDLAAKRRAASKPGAPEPGKATAASPPRRNALADKAPEPRGTPQQRAVREDNTRRDVAAVAVKPAPPQRSRGPRRRSPGFYSVSNFPAVDGIGLDAAKAPKIEIRSATEPAGDLGAAPPIEVEAVEPSSGLAEEREETNPGLGHARSRHDPKVAKPLPEQPARFLAEFASEMALEQDVAGWLESVVAAVETLIVAARESNRDELLGQLRQLLLLLQQDTAWTERRDAARDLILQMETTVAWPFQIAQGSEARSALIVERVLASVAGVDASALEKVQRHKLLSLLFWQTLEPKQVRKYFPAQPEWFDEARAAFEAYTQQRQATRLAAVKLGCSGAVSQVLQELREADRQFQNACDEDNSAGRRATRRHRQVKSAEALLLLAEFGEVDILRKIEHSSVQGKIECLDQWLEDVTPD